MIDSQSNDINETIGIGNGLDGVVRDGVFTKPGDNGTVLLPSVNFDRHLIVVKNDRIALPTRTPEQQVSDLISGLKFKDYAFITGNFVDHYLWNINLEPYQSIYFDSRGYTWRVSWLFTSSNPVTDTISGRVRFDRAYHFVSDFTTETVTAIYTISSAGVTFSAHTLTGSLEDEFSLLHVEDQTKNGSKVILQFSNAAIYEFTIDDSVDESLHAYPLNGGTIEFVISHEVKFTDAEVFGQYDRVLSSSVISYIYLLFPPISEPGLLVEYIQEVHGFNRSDVLNIGIESQTEYIKDHVVSVCYDKLENFCYFSVDHEVVQIKDYQASDGPSGRIDSSVNATVTIKRNGIPLESKSVVSTETSTWELDIPSAIDVSNVDITTSTEHYSASRSESSGGSNASKFPRFKSFILGPFFIVRNIATILISLTGPDGLFNGVDDNDLSVYFKSDFIVPPIQFYISTTDDQFSPYADGAWPLYAYQLDINRQISIAEIRASDQGATTRVRFGTMYSPDDSFSSPHGEITGPSGTITILGTPWALQHPVTQEWEVPGITTSSDGFSSFEDLSFI